MQACNLSAPPQFRIGNILVPNRLALAPMDGFSDSPFRTIAKQYGAGLLFSEFINAMDIMDGVALAHQKMLFHEHERPIGIQIFDDQPERLLLAAIVVEKKYQPDFLDINFSCPDRRVVARGAGAALLSKPSIIAQMVQTLSREIALPVTAKIRLGLNENDRNYLEIARIIEENGAKCISVHARTAAAGLDGSTEWNAITEIKNAAQLPVIGNGDVRSPDDIQQMHSQTGCDAVMIGRAAIGNPWLFSRRSRNDVPAAEIKSTILNHFELSRQNYGSEKGLVVFRKHFKQYAKAFNPSQQTLNAMLTSPDPELFITMVENEL